MKEIIKYVCAVCLLTLVGCNSPIHDHFIPLTNDIGDGVGCYINYTTTDGQILDVFDTDRGATIIANFYADGKGTIIFDKPITMIEAGAFHGCESLTSITIPDGVTWIEYYAFSVCSSLTSITIPDGVTSIGDSAFGRCSSLTSVTIGNGVTEIGDWAFNGCSILESVYCKATTPPTLYGDAVFDRNGTERRIYVPKESVDAYKSAKWWREYANDIVGYDF